MSRSNATFWTICVSSSFNFNRWTFKALGVRRAERRGGLLDCRVDGCIAAGGTSLPDPASPVINDSYTFIQSTLLSDGKRGAEARRVLSDPESRLPSAGESIPGVAFMLAWCRCVLPYIIGSAPLMHGSGAWSAQTAGICVLTRAQIPIEKDRGEKVAVR